MFTKDRKNIGSDGIIPVDHITDNKAQRWESQSDADMALILSLTQHSAISFT